MTPFFGHIDIESCACVQLFDEKLHQLIAQGNELYILYV